MYHEAFYSSCGAGQQNYLKFFFFHVLRVNKLELLTHANSGSFWQVSCTLHALLFNALSGLYMLAADSIGILLLMLLSIA